LSKPNLVLFRDLIKPVNDTKRRLVEIETELQSPTTPLVQQSLFAFAFATFEIMTNDVLKYILLKFPQKICTREFKIPKEFIVNTTDINSLLDLEIEKVVQSLAYKNLTDYIQDFCSITAINNFEEDILDQLIERKATRNLLLHNNLVVNHRYNETSGRLRRTPDYGEKLLLNLPYIVSTIDFLKTAINIIEQGLTDKYSDYTKVKALKSLWEHLFNSPVMNFDDYWDYSNDSIIRFKYSERKDTIENCLSGSERTILALWLIHFNSSLHDIFVGTDFLTYTLDDKRKQDLLYLLSLITNDPELFKTP